MRLRVLAAVVVVGVWIVAWSVSVREEPPDEPAPERTPSPGSPPAPERTPAAATADWARRLVTASGGISDEGVADIVRRGRSSLGILRELLSHEDEEVRNAALDALSQLGPVAREIGSEIVDVMLEDPLEFVRLHAMSAAVAVGGDSVTSRLMEIPFEPHSPEKRILAIHALGYLGSVVREHAPTLIPLLGDAAPIVRASTISTLAKLGGETALKALLDIALSRERGPTFRELAIQAIGDMGAPARSALGALSSLLHEPDEDLILPALLRSLTAIGGDQSLQVLVEYAKTASSGTDRMWAVTYIGHLGAGARPAVPLLIDWMDDRTNGPEARTALSRIAGEETIARLASILCEDRSSQRRRCAAEVLGRIDPPAVTAVPALVTALADKEVLVKQQAAWSLGRIGPAAASALPALRLLRASSDRILRKLAIRAIIEIEGD